MFCGGELVESDLEVVGIVERIEEILIWESLSFCVWKCRARGFTERMYILEAWEPFKNSRELVRESFLREFDLSCIKA